MPTLTNGTWVLIANGEKAMFLRNDLDEINPGLSVVRLEEQEIRSDSEYMDDRPGRRPDLGPGQRSAMETPDWHAIAKERFADEMADILYRYAHGGKFDRIVLVAPSRILGELRDKMHKVVTDRVVAEVSKDLTNHPLHKVEEMLKAELDPAA
ncbi:MAG: host attachment family protein [Roseovarius sp.]|nr:host attachment family protein [Roseovarius sp.]